MTTDKTTTTTTDDTDDPINDETIRALRRLATADGNLRVVELTARALAPAALHPIAGEAERVRREARAHCALEWAAQCERTGLVIEPPVTITDQQVRVLMRLAELEQDTVLVSVCHRALRAGAALRLAQVEWSARRLMPRHAAPTVAIGGGL